MKIILKSVRSKTWYDLGTGSILKTVWSVNYHDVIDHANAKSSTIIDDIVWTMIFEEICFF